MLELFNKIATELAGDAEVQKQLFGAFFRHGRVGD